MTTEAYAIAQDNISAGYIKVASYISPANGTIIPIAFSNTNCKLIELRGTISGTTPSLTANLYFGTNRSGTGNTVIATNITISNTTTGNVISSFTVPNITGNTYIWASIANTSGTITDVNLVLRF